ncbi:MAG: pentapeptide repeat-containing protein, partial [Cyanobacteria bacterium J06627_8]
DFSDSDLSRANLSSAKLNGANLYGADLSRAEMCNADLSHANLSHANLPRADLSNATLVGTNFTASYLSNAFMNGADLTEAVLTAAILCHADLRLANCTRINLMEAMLSDADLRSAYLQNADIRGANLRRADLRCTHIRERHLQVRDAVFGANLGLTDLDNQFLEYRRARIENVLSSELSFSRRDVISRVMDLHDILNKFHRYILQLERNLNRLRASDQMTQNVEELDGFSAIEHLIVYLKRDYRRFKIEIDDYQQQLCCPDTDWWPHELIEAYESINTQIFSLSQWLRQVQEISNNLTERIQREHS